MIILEILLAQTIGCLLSLGAQLIWQHSLAAIIDETIDALLLQANRAPHPGGGAESFTTRSAIRSRPRS
ncbi:hypothetical protein [Brevibacillus nitrificans]|uniref:hypothetical protein n=1 Tax=Brevibacillus nitrificans TaxID=651560 RepID=UPI00285812D7|nr:hypothetical protein [Brevibacillus nitrificans]MDR7316619.1 hypothetical protein [Brevibacillus nitrificans]